MTERYSWTNEEGREVPTFWVNDQELSYDKVVQILNALDQFADEMDGMIVIDPENMKQIKISKIED